jgi:hypothetical protein
VANSHGAEQSRRLFNDRVFLKFYRDGSGKQRIVDETSSIYKWVEARFGGSTVVGPVVWNNEVPYSGLPSGAFRGAYTPRTKTAPVSLQIAASKDALGRKRVNLGFEELWAILAFELHNIENEPRWWLLLRDARSGKTNSEEFILRAAKLEYEAEIRTLDFYNNTWKEWAANADFESDISIWKPRDISDFDKWVASFGEKWKSEYPWVIYRSYFEMITRPRTSETDEGAPKSERNTPSPETIEKEG